MATPEGPLQGPALLAAISHAVAGLHERHHRRPPGTITTRLMGDDLLACVRGGVDTDVETLEHPFVEAVERLSGRRVLDFVSMHHVGPDLEIELFFLADPD